MTKNNQNAQEVSILSFFALQIGVFYVTMWFRLISKQILSKKTLTKIHFTTNLQGGKITWKVIKMTSFRGGVIILITFQTGS